MESWMLVTGALLIGALLSYAVAIAWRNAWRGGDAPPPLFTMLGLRGRPADQVLDELGADAIARALRRCVFCSSGESCRQRAGAGLPMPDYCPNQAFIEHACCSRTI